MASNNTPPSSYELVDLLHSGTLRCKTALWLVPKEYLGREADEAARLCVELVDLPFRLLESLSPEARFADLTARRVKDLIRTIANDSQGMMNCVLLVGLDLLLSGVTLEERREIWNDLFDLPHMQRSLLAALPATATMLLPPFQDLELWKRSGRLGG